jgi:hypothetical protein
VGTLAGYSTDRDNVSIKEEQVEPVDKMFHRVAGDEANQMCRWAGGDGMKRALGTLLIAVFFAAGPVRAGENWVLTFGKLGPVRVGMTPQAVSKVFSGEVTREPTPDDPDCYYIFPKVGGDSIAFMVTEGRISRIDVTAPGFYTADGIQVGDTEERVKSIHGEQLVIEPHHYLAPDGNTLTITNDRGLLAIRFETYQGKVTAFYTGRFPEVEYAEGCL